MLDAEAVGKEVEGWVTTKVNGCELPGKKRAGWWDQQENILGLMRKIYCLINK